MLMSTNLNKLLGKSC